MNPQTQHATPQRGPGTAATEAASVAQMFYDRVAETPDAEA